MRMISVTNIRRNIRKVLMEVVQTKEPMVIVQRSKPVVYLVDAETFEKMQSQNDAEMWTHSRKESLDRITNLRGEIAERAGRKSDSTPLIRELREEIVRRG